jgi:predicted dehydrogenase
MENQLTIGIIGAGGFAAFAGKAFCEVAGARIVSVFDVDHAAAGRLASELGASVSADISDLLADTGVALVYIATPPFLHYEQSKAALLAGKHVICEKPAALRTTEAEELQAIAGEQGRLYVVNLMQRYNPLYAVVKDIIDHQILGNFLHGFFENYASDGNLGPSHWFWDEAKSGGIFIEHGVHFFDLFSGWLGEGRLLSSLQLSRPAMPAGIVDRVQAGIVDRVQAVVLYEDGPVQFYHGFDQPSILDRQEMRLQFERGDISLYGWVPVQMKLYALLQSQQLAALKEIMHHSSMVIAIEGSPSHKTRGRGKEILYDAVVTIDYGNLQDKQERYKEMLKRFLRDQWDWIIDPTHRRLITDANAVGSLRMAEEATRFGELDKNMMT